MTKSILRTTHVVADPGEVLKFWNRIFGSKDTENDGGGLSIVGPDEVSLEPAVPADLGRESVACSHPAPRLYSLYSGEERHGPAVVLTLESGERIVIGTGSRFQASGEDWVVMGFDSLQGLTVRRASTVELSTLVIPRDNPEVYPGAEVSNLWVQTAKPVGTWEADLTAVARRDPAALAGFLKSVLEAGERTGVLRIHEVSAVGFSEEEYGPFSAWMGRRAERGEAPEMLSFLGGHRQTSVLSYIDQYGRLVEGTVQDLGLILKAEEPYEAAMDAFTEPAYAITLDGASELAVSRAAAGLDGRRVSLRFVVHADIWFPWINGAAHPLCDYRRKFDNRILARLNAPRLNGFLAAVAEAAEGLGGTFTLDWEESAVRREYICDAGVVLDVAEPAETFTEEDRNVDW